MYKGNDIWLKKLATGDDSAFRQVFEEYFATLVLFADSYVNNTELSKDIVQSCLLDICGNKEVLSSVERLKKYLYSSVKNRCLKHLKNEKCKDKCASDFIYSTEEDVSFWHKVLEEEVFLHLYYSRHKNSEQQLLDKHSANTPGYDSKDEDLEQKFLDKDSGNTPGYDSKYESPKRYLDTEINSLREYHKHKSVIVLAKLLGQYIEESINKQEPQAESSIKSKELQADSSISEEGLQADSRIGKERMQKENSISQERMQKESKISEEGLQIVKQWKETSMYNNELLRSFMNEYSLNEKFASYSSLDWKENYAFFITRKNSKKRKVYSLLKRSLKTVLPFTKKTY